jgi:HAD superfamily hydrolase (TIGR01509 family)
MTDHAITFDFHNTLAACPEWFELEVRRLPSAFLRWHADGRADWLTSATLDDADARYRQLRREIMDHGDELSAEECLAGVFGGMGLAIPDAEIAAGVEHLMRAALAGASPVPGAVETVRAIHAAGVTLGIVSSAVYHPFLEWTLAAFGIRDAFAAVVTSASARYYKSRPELYWHAAQRLGVRPARMVHIGDSLRFDVAGAHRAGLGTVWLRRREEEGAVDAIRPDLTLDTLTAAAPEILALLRARISDDVRPTG